MNPWMNPWLWIKLGIAFTIIGLAIWGMIDVSVWAQHEIAQALHNTTTSTATCN